MLRRFFSDFEFGTRSKLIGSLTPGAFLVPVASFVLVLFVWSLTPSWRVQLLVLASFLATVLALASLSYVAPDKLWQVMTIPVLGFFAATLGVRYYLFMTYRMEPRSLLVIQAVSNTSLSETASYLRQNAVPITEAAALALAAFVAMWLIVRRACAFIIRAPASPRRRWVFLFTGIAVVAHANPAFRRENPPFFWLRASADYSRWMEEVARIGIMRAVALGEVSKWAPRLRHEAPSTIIVVIGESQNRNNLSLYGYARATTPGLDAVRDQLCVLRNAYSYSAATTAAFIDMLTTGDGQKPGEWWRNPTLPMLAKAAGYQMFWISNQNDRFIEATFGKDFDDFRQINLGGSREDISLDGDVLPHVEAALDHSARKKLVVVHLIGQHPHYDLRYPAHFARFGAGDDKAEAVMAAGGALPWVRTARNHYDNSIRYTDSVLSSILRRLTQRGGERASFLYLSDHANDVGHEGTAVGHAPTRKAGYEIPLIYAGPRTAECRTNENAEYQTNRLLWTLLDLLEIDVSVGAGTRSSILSDRFEVQPIQKHWK